MSLFFHHTLTYTKKSKTNTWRIFQTNRFPFSPIFCLPSYKVSWHVNYVSIETTTCPKLFFSYNPLVTTTTKAPTTKSSVENDLVWSNERTNMIHKSSFNLPFSTWVSNVSKCTWQAYCTHRLLFKIFIIFCLPLQTRQGMEIIFVLMRLKISLFFFSCYN